MKKGKRTAELKERALIFNENLTHMVNPPCCLQSIANASSCCHQTVDHSIITTIAIESNEESLN